MTNYYFNNNSHSQNGEEAKIIEILLENDAAEMGIDFPHFCVELGAGNGYDLSNTRYFIEEHKWKAIQIDADNRGNGDVKQEFIDKDNIVGLLQKYGCPTFFELLSIDLDGNDFWVLDSILKEFEPTLIVAEFNACFPQGTSQSIIYDPEFRWAGDDYFGFTLEAGRKLADKHGYQIICQHADMNLFLLHKSKLKNKVNPDLSYNLNTFFSKSGRTDWETI
jgi:hypothetical protein